MLIFKVFVFLLHGPATKFYIRIKEPNQEMVQKAHHRREILFLIGFMLIFLILMIISFVNINRSTPVFGLGISYLTEDIIILILSFLGILKVIWHIITY
jgi:hypothetical protein